MLCKLGGLQRFECRSNMSTYTFKRSSTPYALCRVYVESRCKQAELENAVLIQARAAAAQAWIAGGVVVSGNQTLYLQKEGLTAFAGTLDVRKSSF